MTAREREREKEIELAYFKLLRKLGSRDQINDIK